MTIFGPILDASEVEEDIKAHLVRWLPTYLAEMAERHGLPRGTWIREDGSVVGTWTNSTEFEVQDTTALPAILIINTGLADQPIMEGDGSYRVAWVIGIGGLVSAGGDNPAKNTNDLSKRFAAGVRWAILQHQAINNNPNVEDVDWIDEGYDDVPSETKTLASFRLVFRIEYRNVLSANEGPGSPDPTPDPVPPDSYPDWLTIPDTDHIHVDIKKET